MIIITITHFPHISTQRFSVFLSFSHFPPHHICRRFSCPFQSNPHRHSPRRIISLGLCPYSLSASGQARHHRVGLNGATKLVCAKKASACFSPASACGPACRRWLRLRVWLFDILPRGWRAKEKRRLRMISCKYRLDLSALLYQYYACTDKNKCTQIVRVEMEFKKLLISV